MSIESDDVRAPDEWGASVDGLQVRIWFDGVRREFAPGAPVVVRFAIRNAGDADRMVVHGGFWPDNRVDVFRGDDLAPLRPYGEGRRSSFGAPTREKTASQVLRPKEIDEAWTPIDLGKLFDLSEPGRYRVQVVHRTARPATSNELHFEVRPR
jgi:hypothetical protein